MATLFHRRIQFWNDFFGSSFSNQVWAENVHKIKCYNMQKFLDINSSYLIKCRSGKASNFQFVITGSMAFSKTSSLILTPLSSKSLNKKNSNWLHYTVWKLWKFNATILSQKFRQIYFFTKELYSKLIWRKKLSDREFHVFPHRELFGTK